METKRLTDLRFVNIKRVDEGKLVRLRLHFDESTRQPVLELDIPPDDLMALMVALQRFQASHKIPIPPNLRPQGPPLLSVVSD